MSKLSVFLRMTAIAALAFLFFPSSFKATKMLSPGSLVIEKRPIVWEFQCSFPEDFKQEARAGFTYWNRLAGYELFYEDVCTDSTSEFGSIVVMYSDRSLEGSSPDSYTLAQTSFILMGAVRTVTFFREWTDPDNIGDMVTVSRHEVGHVLGFDHGDDPSCLMYPSVEPRSHGRDGKACRSEVRMFRRFYGRRPR